MFKNIHIFINNCESEKVIIAIFNVIKRLQPAARLNSCCCQVTYAICVILVKEAVFKMLRTNF